MDRDATPAQEQPDSQPIQAYEPPRIETVLTPEELEREVLYAGNIIGSRGGVLEEFGRALVPYRTY